MKKILFILFAFLAICIGLYPVIYIVADMSQGLLGSKPTSLLDSSFYMSMFYIHIIPGGLALLLGWSQFSSSLRKKNIGIHRNLGKAYVIMVILSGFAGLFIAHFSTGGIISRLGFETLAIAWLFTTFKAFISIRKHNIDSHQRWMIRSFALCFAAVTLRIELPFLEQVLNLDFIDAYRIVAWLCWVPNLIVAELIVRKI